jgi:hypothetical protein
LSKKWLQRLSIKRQTLLFLIITARLRGAQQHKTRRWPAHEKITGYLQNTQDTIMEAERINLIGNTLNDLAERTRELRGYL